MNDISYPVLNIDDNYDQDEDQDNFRLSGMSPKNRKFGKNSGFGGIDSA